MSKSTTITCNGCGATFTGIGYATLWAKLRKHGWTIGDNTRQTHYCRQCAILREARMDLERTARKRETAPQPHKKEGLEQ